MLADEGEQRFVAADLGSEVGVILRVRELIMLQFLLLCLFDSSTEATDLPIHNVGHVCCLWRRPSTPSLAHCFFQSVGNRVEACRVFMRSTTLSGR